MNAYSMLPWNCVHGSGEKDGQDEGDGSNLVLQSKEWPTKHDVSVNKVSCGQTTECVTDLN
jgi:hypothetical protein